MKRTTILALMVVMAALLLAGGAAYAKIIQCTGGKCVGTERLDLMRGTTGADEILGRGGNDQISGDKGDNDPAGDDVIRGGAGADVIVDDDGLNGDSDQLFGGKGNDTLNVLEDDITVDFVDCGPGFDLVFADGEDFVKQDTCEDVRIS